VPDNHKYDADFLDAIRRERDNLVEQIRLSRETIERSLELIKRIDEMLAKSGRKP
jgi:hypothetical protein